MNNVQHNSHIVKKVLLNEPGINQSIMKVYVWCGDKTDFILDL